MSEGTPASPANGAGTALVRRASDLIGEAEIERTWRIAKALHASGMFPDIKKAEQAWTKILLGRDLGLNPTQAMTGIHIVEGKPQVAAVTLASFVREIGNDDYRVLTHSDTECSIEFGRGTAPGKDADGKWLPWPEAFGVSTFRIEDANKAGLVKDKSGWVKYPMNMLFARAMSNGVKWFCPEATHGVPVYHDGEIVTEEIGAGTGDGQPQGLELGPEVEAVLKRAADLGHAGLSDRATVEMALADQPAEFIAEWVTNAARQLDELEPADADVVPEDESAVDLPAQYRAQAARLREEAEDAHLAGDDATAAGLIADAERLESEIAVGQ